MRSDKEASGVVRDIVYGRPDTGPCLRVYKSLRHRPYRTAAM
jgi:hypothetical protein